MMQFSEHNFFRTLATAGWGWNHTIIQYLEAKEQIGVLHLEHHKYVYPRRTHYCYVDCSPRIWDEVVFPEIQKMEGLVSVRLYRRYRRVQKTYRIAISGASTRLWGHTTRRYIP